MGSIIDEIYVSMAVVDKLFQRRFQHSLFCVPLDAQSILHNAVKGEVKLTDLVAAIGLVLDGICEREIELMLGKPKGMQGSINKLEALLKKEGFSYEPRTISTFKALHNVRSSISHIHNTGPKIIEILQKLNIAYPIDNDRAAALTLLQNLNKCIKEMKDWFG